MAFGLLLFVGGKMLWEAFRGEKEAKRDDPTRGWMLVLLSIATSIDALAVGLSMAFLQISIWVPSVVIGFVAGALTAIGILSGSRIGTKLGCWPQIVGGLVLIGIGVRILVVHLIE